MKKTLSIIYLLLVSASFVSAQEHKSTEPSKFSFGSIPYGKPMEEVLKMVEGAKVWESDYVSIETIGNYEDLSSYFAGGLYTIMGLGTYLNSNVVKKYTAAYDKWDNIDKIDLYFVKKFGSNEPHTLFLVRKFLKAPEGSYENVFNGMKGSVTEKIGVAPEVFKVKYQTDSMKAKRTYEPAFFGVWTLEYSKVFLLVASSFYRTRRPEILYLSNNGWKNYLDSIDAYEIYMKQIEENKSKKMIGDF